VTQYESIIDPSETWLEKWLLHGAAEVYNYWSCLQAETNPRVRAVWERFVDYELGHLRIARETFEKVEKRDAAEILPKTLPDPIEYRTHREFVRKVLAAEVDLRASGTEFIHRMEEKEDSPSVLYRNHMNSEGSPTETVAAGWSWRPGTEATSLAAAAARGGA
ncbi:MAG TPA: hypothetical protein VK081_06585, partial [Planctomycetota bacterium]|nr:hypothetical protein [Planctomycetota bacterium]